MSDITKCTWKDCMKEGIHPQRSNDGSIWAILCDEHNRQIDEDIEQLRAKELVRDWILAQGGAKKAAERM